MRDLASSLARVKAEIADACKAHGRQTEDVRLVAVSKFHPEQVLREAACAGQRDFGENYVQEAIAKQNSLRDLDKPIRWHLIGHIQSRKAKDIAGKFDLIHTLDSIKLADALNRHMDGQAKQKVLIEVNVGREPQKSGIMPELTSGLVKHTLENCPGLELHGFMCMAPLYNSGDKARPWFADLRELRDRVEREFGVALPELSMGMSGDFRSAIAEGATIVRIGTSIFGPRPLRES